MTTAAEARRTRALPAALLDAALVLVFVAIGRAEHDSGPLVGVLTTAWPFLVALAAGWLVARAWRVPSAVAPTGLVVWAVTLVGGVLLRLASGDTAAPAFVVVAAVTLALFLLGWRALAVAVAAIRRRRR
ncbi:DUF3054 domain-containing protein [Desertivibrio insolitus]|uniref:DUF3054 domain-containing protein n=1 Tax=Herbiconiux sp. SYSU D00978 TaxID=2812562 RepID=UPI001A971954|nr:DUF3054 domain-containing protein [Herbiconiux sp. SYSU D00978]